MVLTGITAAALLRRQSAAAQHWVLSVGGTVVFEARIGTDGTVTEVRAVPPVDTDLENARAAVSQWEFTPTLLNCVPIEVDLNVNVSFSQR